MKTCNLDVGEEIKAVRSNLVTSVRGNRRQRSLAFLCCLLFVAGLLVQLLSPHLKITNRAFVIPPEMSAGNNPIRLEEIVDGQRRTQVISALLTLGGAVGLAFLYRETLVKAVSRRSSRTAEEPTGADPMRSQQPSAAQKL